MDAKEFAGLIAENASKLANAERDHATEKTRADGLAVRVTELSAELDTLKGSDLAKQVTALTAERDTLKTQLTNTQELPATLLQPLFAMAGMLTTKLDADPEKAAIQVKELGDSLKATGARLSVGSTFVPLLPGRQGAGANAGFKRRA